MIPLSEAEFELFRDFINKHVGISFSRLKRLALQRRLVPRLRQLGLESYQAYYRYLLHDKQGEWELRQLINAVTVGQTAFFRHAEQFEFLAKVILPQIATQNKTTKKLRIWSAGCSTGQEAYSIAMVVNEMFKGDGTWDIKILGSDVDTEALKFAYKGLYPRDCVEDILPKHLKRYFKKRFGKDAGFYLVTEALRKNILFRRLNFVHSEFPFKSPVNIIFCRNVMIYFDADGKKKLIDHFFRILERDGFLCLGTSESLIGVDKRFALVEHATYQKKGRKG